MPQTLEKHDCESHVIKCVVVRFVSEPEHVIFIRFASKTNWASVDDVILSIPLES